MSILDYFLISHSLPSYTASGDIGSILVSDHAEVTLLRPPFGNTVNQKDGG